MARILPALTLLLLVGCSSAKPATHRDPLVNRSVATPSVATATEPAAPSTAKPDVDRAAVVDPVNEPTIVGAVDEAVLQASIKGEQGAAVGRRVGRVAGFLAAVFGGPKSESLDETVDRYRRTRDAVTVVGAIIGATDGAMEGAERGYDLDVQFAELHAMEGLEVFRPAPDLIEVRFASTPDPETLVAVAAIFLKHAPRAIQIEAAGDTPLDIREVLMAEGLTHDSIATHRNDDLAGVVLRLSYLL
ncbi:MAG TPA: hypothetical protein VGF48_20950 [Thermoanaerobaculia bacterium]